MTTEKTMTPAGDRLLTVNEVATRLGLSARSVWKHAAAETMPVPVRIGRAVRWRESDLSEFIRRGCIVEGAR